VVTIIVQVDRGECRLLIDCPQDMVLSTARIILSAAFGQKSRPPADASVENRVYAADLVRPARNTGHTAIGTGSISLDPLEVTSRPLLEWAWRDEAQRRPVPRG
jgi:hypothetical protein